VMRPQADMIAFIEKYQDRLLYATDNEFSADANVSEVVRSWENTYAFDWRFFATNDTLQYRNHKVQGLNLPVPVLRKLYHQNAVRWIPGVLGPEGQTKSNPVAN